MSSTDAAAPGPLRPPVHVPVLLERVTELLAPACAADGAVLVDATLGLAGHTLAMLDAHPGLRLIGLDRDPEARAEAARRIEAAGHTDRATLVPAVFDELPDVLDRLGIDEVQGVLFDLGVSSLQLDRPDRGFSYSADAPLDMRMDPGARRTAADVVNTYPPKELARVLRVYGEERFASRIAAAIERERARSPSPPPRGSPSWSATPSRRPPAAPAATRRSGRSRRCASRSTTSSASWSGRCRPRSTRWPSAAGSSSSPSTPSRTGSSSRRWPPSAVDRTPPEFPVPVPELGPVLRLLTRGGEAASEAELAANPRAASARVRAAERIRRAA